MKRLLYATLFICLWSHGFGMVYPVGDANIQPTTSFSSGNGYVITQTFLYVGIDGKTHLGVDLATYNNASGGDVRAVESGTVTYVQNSQATTGWGAMVRIRHQLPNGTVYFSYPHPYPHTHPFATATGSDRGCGAHPVPAGPSTPHPDGQCPQPTG